MNNAIIRVLLEKLNMGITRFEFSELNNADEDPDFGEWLEVKELVSKGFIREEEEKKYQIIVDIGTLRKYALEKDRGDMAGDAGIPSCEPDEREIAQSAWRLKNMIGQTDAPQNAADESGASEDESEGEKERFRREYLEARRRKLIELITRDNGDEEREDRDDSKDFDYEIEEPSEEENPTERNLHDRLVNILSDTGEAAGYVAKALQLCVNEGFVSIRLLCRDLQISENRASAICRWLYLSDFTERDESDAEKYRLAFSEKFFRSCDEEAKARRDEVSRLASDLGEAGGEEGSVEGKMLFSEKSVCRYKFLKSVRERLLGLIGDDKTITRTKAITKAEGCLYAVRELSNDTTRKVYEEVLYELENMSDYIFNRLKNQLKA